MRDRWREIRKSLLRERGAMIGLALLVIVLLMALAAPLAPYGPKERDTATGTAPPSCVWTDATPAVSTSGARTCAASSRLGTPPAVTSGSGAGYRCRVSGRLAISRGFTPTASITSS